uniref:Uncharacterized protein n=1 Tax=Biomphalaria glabrata TaxID=6526 RepID=A0A2C9LGP4_BIOGL
MTSKSKISNLLKGKSVPNLPSYSSPWTKQDKELMKAVEAMDVKKVGTLLIKKPIITTKLGPNGKSVFHCACEIGNKQILDLILSKTQDVNDSTCQGVTALHIAASQGHAFTVEKLLKHQASVDKKDSNKMTALHHACAGQHLECVKVLLMSKADPQAIDQAGRTPLHYAAHKGGPYGVTICQWLIEKGAQVNSQDKDKTSSLMLAAREGHADVCAYLLSHGAIADLQDKTGLTALEQAGKRGHTSLQEIFERVPNRVFENSSEQGSYTPSESGSATHDQIDGMSPVLQTRSRGYGRAAVSVCDSESYSRTDAHSLHSFHSMDDELLTNHQSRNSQPSFLNSFTSNLEVTYNELKADHEKLNVDYKNVSIENIRLRDKLEALHMKMEEIHQNEVMQVKQLEEKLASEKEKVEELEKKLKELVDSQVRKDSQEEWTQCDNEISLKGNQEIDLMNDDHMLNKLKTQILALKQENDQLKTTKTWDGIIENNGTQSSDLLDHEVNQFVTERKMLQAQISELKQQKEKLEQLQSVDTEDLLHQNSAMASELEVLRQEVTSLRESLPTEAQRLDALINQNFEEVNFDEEGFVDGRDMTKEEFLQGQNQQLKAQCSLLTEELIKLRTTFDAILKAGDNLQADYDQLAAEKDAIQDDLEAALREKQNIITENEYLMNDTNELHDNLNKLVHELEKMQEKHQAAQAECDELKRSVAVAGKVGEVTRLLEENDDLKNKCSDLQEIKDRLQHDHNILMEEVQSLTDEVNNLTIEKEQLTSELDETCQQHEALQTDFGQLEIDFGELLREKEKLEGKQLSPDQHSEGTQTEGEFDQVMSGREVVEQLALTNIQESMVEVHFSSSEQEASEVKKDWNDGVKKKHKNEETTRSGDIGDRVILLEEELQHVKAEFAELYKEKEMLQEQLYQSEALLDEDSQVKHFQAEIELLKYTCDELLREKVSLEELLHEARSNTGDDAERLLQLESDFADLLREKEALEERINFQAVGEVDLTKVQQLEDEFAELLKEKEALESRHLKDHEKLQKFKADYRALLQEKSALEERCQRDFLRLQELEKTVPLLRDKKTDNSRTSDYEKLKAEYQELLLEKEEMENVVHGLSKHNVAIEKKVKHLQNSLAEAKAAINPASHQEEMLRNQEEIILLKKQIAKLTTECADWERKHAETVSTYRTHLLSAVQGHIDPDVKDALSHIIELRSMEQYC